MGPAEFFLILHTVWDIQAIGIIISTYRARVLLNRGGCLHPISGFHWRKITRPDGTRGG